MSNPITTKSFRKYGFEPFSQDDMGEGETLIWLERPCPSGRIVAVYGYGSLDVYIEMKEHQLDQVSRLEIETEDHLEFVMTRLSRLKTNE